jgi:hypothetical protein
VIKIKIGTPGMFSGQEEDIVVWMKEWFVYPKKGCLKKQLWNLAIFLGARYYY